MACLPPPPCGPEMLRIQVSCGVWEAEESEMLTVHLKMVAPYYRVNLSTRPSIWSPWVQVSDFLSPCCLLQTL